MTQHYSPKKKNLRKPLTDMELQEKFDSKSKERLYAKIACGGTHYIIYSKIFIYALGHNSHGQLGLGDKQDKTKLTKVKLPNGEIPIEVACGKSYTIISTHKKDQPYILTVHTFGEV